MIMIWAPTLVGIVLSKLYAAALKRHVSGWAKDQQQGKL